MNSERMTEEELEEVIRINRESPRGIDQTFADMWESMRDEEEDNEA